jgi:hypothetical protein
MLFQELCRRKIGWDEPMPSDIAQQWNQWLEDLPSIHDMKISRCIKSPELGPLKSAQLHHFSDASQSGYGAVTYLRLEDIDGKVHCSLLMSKAKLAPLKTMTIPRLELAAAVVAVKMDELIRHQLELSLVDSVYWSDSMIVLQYLKNDDKRFQTFVANRVATIQDLSSPSQWRYIDTQSNPADDVSRGLKARELVSSLRWSHGPEFLWLQEGKWPVQPTIGSSSLDAELEVKKDPQVYQTITDTKVDIIAEIMGRHSTWFGLRKD